MADKHRVKNFSLDTSLCKWLETQALLENRPQSSVVSIALREYLSKQAAAMKAEVSAA